MITILHNIYSAVLPMSFLYQISFA